MPESQHPGDAPQPSQPERRQPQRRSSTAHLPGWGEPPPLPPGLPRQTADNSSNQEGHSSAPIDLAAAYRGAWRIDLDEIQFTPEEFPEGPYGSPWLDR